MCLRFFAQVEQPHYDLVLSGMEISEASDDHDPSFSSDARFTENEAFVVPEYTLYNAPFEFQDVRLGMVSIQRYVFAMCLSR
jgi:hypothetical protein